MNRTHPFLRLILISFSLFFVQNIFSVEYTKRSDFSELLYKRNNDSSIDAARRVFDISKIYKAFISNDEVVVYNYYKNASLFTNTYIPETTTNNHWIQLVANENESVTLKIEVAGEQLSEEMVSFQGFECVPSFHNGSMTLKIDKTNQRGMIIFNDNEEEPLFIFVDTPLKAESKRTVTFDGYTKQNYVLPPDVDTVILPLGSYYVGNIRSSHPFSVIGHGIISQEGTPHRSYEDGEDNGLKCNISSDKNTPMTIQGITSIEPSLYQFWAWPCKGVKYKQVKCFGFQYETDSFIGDEVIDCFSKANDDHVKLYHSNIVVKNLTVYLQGNGNVFQFGWGNYGSRDSILVDGVTLLRDLNIKNSKYARSFINWRKPDYDLTISNVLIKNVQALDEVKLFLSIVQTDLSKLPAMKNFQLENIHLTQGLKYPIQIIANDQVNIGFKNIVVDQTAVDSNNLSNYINSSLNRIYFMK